SVKSSRQRRHAAVAAQTDQNTQNTSVTQMDIPKLEAAAAENKKMRVLLGWPHRTLAGPLAGSGYSSEAPDRGRLGGRPRPGGAAPPTPGCKPNASNKPVIETTAADRCCGTQRIISSHELT